jgi:hypothetical protein
MAAIGTGLDDVDVVVTLTGNVVTGHAVTVQAKLSVLLRKL